MIEKTLEAAGMIDPRFPYWIEKIMELSGTTESSSVLIAAAYLLSESEDLINRFDKYGF